MLTGLEHQVWAAGLIWAKGEALQGLSLPSMLGELFRGASPAKIHYGERAQGPKDDRPFRSTGDRRQERRRRPRSFLMTS